MGERGARRGVDPSGASPRASLAPVRRDAPGPLRRSFIDTIRHGADALLSVLLAPACVGCGDLLQTPLAGPMCDACWQAIVPLTPPLCTRCGDSIPAWRVTDLVHAHCARCRRGGSHVSRLVAAGAYEGTLRAAIHALKYDGRRTLAGRLGALMREAGTELIADADGVVPVPLHASRLRARGFNQAADLARAIGLPVAPVLRRTRATDPQADLPAARRHGNVRGAFAAAHAIRRWNGAVLVLVDDVSTTGATLDACASALLAAGAAEVRALTAARAVRSRP